MHEADQFIKEETQVSSILPMFDTHSGKISLRHLKVLLSIGGWTYSPSMHSVIVNPTLRANFVTSSIKILEDYGFDGLDIDYEYPGNPEQAHGYLNLLKELRQGLDYHAHTQGLNYKFLLTVRALFLWWSILKVLS